MAPGMSSRPITSQQSRVLWRRPLPSDPSTRTTGRVIGTSSKFVSPVESRPIRWKPLSQGRERVAEIAHDHEGHVPRPPGGFRQDACRRRAVPGRRDDGLHVEGRSRADDGAHIVRVGDLVEGQNHAGAAQGVD